MHLPLSWDDPATREAIERYMQRVRADAPWCPWNIEFIRRINGLDDVDDVRRIVFDARYLVLGLGDVYLGAPVATPLDPRHRLVTTKYNPARTWTPENAVGIGGAYLCIYGMEGPGGYQFVGRTVQVWNRFGRDRPTSSPSTRGCCASSTASAGIRSTADELPRLPGGLRAPAASASTSRTARLICAPYERRVPRENAQGHRRVPGRRESAAFRAGRAAWARGEFEPATRRRCCPAAARPARFRPTVRSSPLHDVLRLDTWPSAQEDQVMTGRPMVVPSRR